MNNKNIWILLLLLCFGKLSFAWGFWAHQRINRLSVFTLPPEMLVFYKKHIEYITTHAVDPDKRRYTVENEAPKHYIDLDHYCTYPCTHFPKTWNDATEMYSEDTLQAYGIVPWHIYFMMFRLTEAFQSKNQEKILAYSSEIGHYIADAHVPLHTTKNYNGQLTGQKGIHGFWESRLPELFHDNYDFFVGKAIYLESPLQDVWTWVLESHAAVDSVLTIERQLNDSYPKNKKYEFDNKGVSTVKTYSRDYSGAYHAALNGMVERRMRASIAHVGAVWFTCWVNAGQPDLTLLEESNTHRLQDQKENVDTLFMQQKKKHRNHAETGLDIFKNEFEQ